MLDDNEKAQIANMAIEAYQLFSNSYSGRAKQFGKEKPARAAYALHLSMKDTEKLYKGYSLPWSTWLEMVVRKGVTPLELLESVDKVQNQNDLYAEFRKWLTENYSPNPTGV